MGVAIDIENVKKAYGSNVVIENLTAHIKPGEFFTLLGPSGCGKTTLLRMIIGFNTIEGGEIKINGNVVNNIPTNKRNIGMVFQNYAVFPHMNVKKNVAYGLKTRKVPKTEIAKRVDDILRLVKIDALSERMPSALSGGQQQRVALARAIVIEPEVLLMDEPLSNLDAKLRVEMRNVIKRIQKQIGITTVYVTHDQEEALAVSDRIAIMNGGVIQQIATPKTIYQYPKNEFVADFIGTSALLDARIENNCVVFDNGYSFPCSNMKTVPNGQKVHVSVRPEEFNITSENNAGISAVIRSSVFLGMTERYFVELENGKEVEVAENSGNRDILEDGKKVKLTLDQTRVNIFDATNGNSLMNVEW